MNLSKISHYLCLFGLPTIQAFALNHAQPAVKSTAVINNLEEGAQKYRQTNVTKYSLVFNLPGGEHQLGLHYAHSEQESDKPLRLNFSGHISVGSEFLCNSVLDESKPIDNYILRIYWDNELIFKGHLTQHLQSLNMLQNRTDRLNAGEQATSTILFDEGTLEIISYREDDGAFNLSYTKPTTGEKIVLYSGATEKKKPQAIALSSHPSQPATNRSVEPRELSTSKPRIKIGKGSSFIFQNGVLQHNPIFTGQPEGIFILGDKSKKNDTIAAFETNNGYFVLFTNMLVVLNPTKYITQRVEFNANKNFLKDDLSIKNFAPQEIALTPKLINALRNVGGFSAEDWEHILYLLTNRI